MNQSVIRFWLRIAVMAGGENTPGRSREYSDVPGSIAMRSQARALSKSKVASLSATLTVPHANIPKTMSMGPNQ